MNGIKSCSSVYVDGQWRDAIWIGEVVDGAGDMIVTATVNGIPPAVTALRLDAELLRKLRSAACNTSRCKTTTQRLDDIEEQLARLHVLECFDH